MADNNQQNNPGGAQGGAAKLNQPKKGGFSPIDNPTEADHGILAAAHEHFGKWLTQAFTMSTTIRKVTNPYTNEKSWNFYSTAFYILHGAVQPHNELKSTKNTQVMLAFMEFMIPKSKDIDSSVTAQVADQRLLDGVNNLLFGNQGGAALLGGYVNMHTPRAAGVDDANDIRTQSVKDLDAFFTARAAGERRAENMAEAHALIMRIFDMDTDAIRALVSESILLAIATYTSRGHITEDKCQKVIDAVQKDNGLKIGITPEMVGIVYAAMDKVVTKWQIDPMILLESLATVATTQISMRLHLVVQQASHSGTSAIGIIASAMADHPKHPVWAFLVDECQHEIKQFTEASRVVVNDQVVGFKSREHTESVKNSPFPNLLYASTRLKVEMENSRTIGRFKGASSAPKAAKIDAIIKEYKENLSREVDLDKYKFADDESMATIVPDLSNIHISLSS